MDKNFVKLSKLLSLILRHKPQVIGLSLDENGWAEVDQLVALSRQHRIPFTQEIIEEIVRTNDKQRFAFNADRSKIRANQGHSVAVDLAIAPQRPPRQLFHGTAMQFMDAIRLQGLLPGNRQHVHLSRDEHTAANVGKRHGEPVVLRIRADAMYRAGHQFYCSDNGVWLTKAVPPEYLLLPPNVLLLQRRQQLSDRT